MMKSITSSWRRAFRHHIGEEESEMLPESQGLNIDFEKANGNTESPTAATTRRNRPAARKASAKVAADHEGKTSFHASYQGGTMARKIYIIRVPG
jgi:hypothetical protein